MFLSYRYLAAAVLATSVGLLTPACAPYTYRDAGYARPRIDRVAFENGYRDGLERGRRDASDRRSSSYKRRSEFRDADQGYRRSDGDRRFYQQQYRAGFERGYAEAYQRYGGRRSGTR